MFHVENFKFYTSSLCLECEKSSVEESIKLKFKVEESERKSNFEFLFFTFFETKQKT